MSVRCVCIGCVLYVIRTSVSTDEYLASRTATAAAAAVAVYCYVNGSDGPVQHIDHTQLLLTAYSVYIHRADHVERCSVFTSINTAYRRCRLCESGLAYSSAAGRSASNTAAESVLL